MLTWIEHRGFGRAVYNIYVDYFTYPNLGLLSRANGLRNVSEILTRQIGPSRLRAVPCFVSTYHPKYSIKQSHPTLSQTFIIAMKPPSVLRVLSRPTALLKPHHSPKIAQLPALDARQFTVTTRRPFLPECLSQTHTLISGLHGMTGLPWVATIPLFAFLVRTVIHLPLSAYCYNLKVKRLMLYKESRIAVEEKNARLEDREKSPQERQRIQDKAVNLLWRRMVKQNKVQFWKSYVLYLNVPTWVIVMETIRRMTGTEDGMLSLIAKQLTAQKGMQNPQFLTPDELVPIEPSLATEGMLWFDNLMIPDPLSILPFILSGLLYVMYSTRKGIIDFQPPPGSTSEQLILVRSVNELKARNLKVAALLIGPATLMFPSAMLLYWFSSSLAAVTLQYLFKRWLRRSRILNIRVSKSPDSNEKPQTQPYRPPTMKELKAQKRKNK